VLVMLSFVVNELFCGKPICCYRVAMTKSMDDSGTQRHLLDDSVLDDAVCTSSDSSLPGSGVCCFIS